MSEDDLDATLSYWNRMDGGRVTDTPATLGALEVGDRSFAVLFACDAMIINGGFAGLFQNPSGNVAGLLPESANYFELREHQAAGVEALTLFGGPYPADFSEREQRWDELCEALGDEIDERLDPLDQRWYAAEDDLGRALAAHARRRL
jgi:hypothetical protein